MLDGAALEWNQRPCKLLDCALSPFEVSFSKLYPIFVGWMAGAGMFRVFEASFPVFFLFSICEASFVWVEGKKGVQRSVEPVGKAGC